MATFTSFEGNLKTALGSLIQKNFSDFANQAQSDATAFLDEARNDLVKWTNLLASGSIDKDEFDRSCQFGKRSAGTACA